MVYIDTRRQGDKGWGRRRRFYSPEYPSIFPEHGPAGPPDGPQSAGDRKITRPLPPTASVHSIPPSCHPARCCPWRALALQVSQPRPEETMREDAALQTVVQFAFHIGGQTAGVEISIE